MTLANDEFSLIYSIMDEVQRSRRRSFGSKPTLWASQSSAVQSDGTVLGKCLRAGFYEKKGVAKTNPVSRGVTMMGYMGMEIEDGLIELIKRTGAWENNNVKWQYRGVSGEVDVIMNTTPGVFWKSDQGERILLEKGQLIVEAKSCSGYYANKEVFGTWSGRAPNKVYTRGRPKIQHLMQSALYADVGREQTDGCLVIYVSRDEAKMKEFLVQTDESGNIYIDGILEQRFTMNDIYSRYEQLKGFIDTNVLPKADYRNVYSDEEVAALLATKQISTAVNKKHVDRKELYMEKNCLYCNHRDLCMSTSQEEIPFVEVESESGAQPALIAQEATPADVELDFFDTPTTKPVVAPDWANQGSF